MRWPPPASGSNPATRISSGTITIPPPTPKSELNSPADEADEDEPQRRAVHPRALQDRSGAPSVCARPGSDGSDGLGEASSAGAVSKSRCRTRKSETRTPTNAIAAPAQNACWKPSVSADGTGVPEATASLVVEVAIVESIAIPTAPPICWDVLISPEARPASSGFVPASAAIVSETNASGSPKPITRKPGNRFFQYDPSTETCVKQDEPQGHHRHADDERRLHSDPGHGRGGDVRPDDRRARDGEIADTGLQRREVEDLLHVERQHQEHREQRRAQDEHDDVGRGQGLQPEDRERHQRMPARDSWPMNPPAARPRRRRRRSSRPEVQPQSWPFVIPSTRMLRPDVTRTAPRTSKPGSRSSRLSVSRIGAAISEMIPTGTLTQKIQGHESTSTRMPPMRTPAAAPTPPTAPHAPRAMLRSRPSRKVVVRMERAAGEIVAAPSPCSARAAISAPSLQARAAEERADGEDDEADHEHTPPAEEVGEAPAEEEEASEDERVGGDHPLQVLLREPEVGLDRGQRDVDDRDVEHDHELHHAEQQQRDPLAPVGLAHRFHPLLACGIDRTTVSPSTCASQVTTS